MTPSDKTTVFIIDDDDRMRAATQRLLKTSLTLYSIVCAVSRKGVLTNWA